MAVGNNLDPTEDFRRRILCNINNMFMLHGRPGDCARFHGDDTDEDTGNDSDCNETIIIPAAIDGYETIYQNIRSYPSITDVSDAQYFIKRYQLPDGGEITLTTDMSTEGLFISTLTGDIPDPNAELVKTTTVIGDTITTVYSDTNNLINMYESYETVYQNIRSYPSTIDMSDERYIIKKYQLPDGGIITLVTDMRNESKIISTLSGDVPGGVDLVKTINVSPDAIVVTYS